MISNVNSSAVFTSNSLLLSKKPVSKYSRLYKWVGRANNMTMVSGSAFFLFGTVMDFTGINKSSYMYFFCALSYLAGAVISTINYEIDLRTEQDDTHSNLV